MNQLLSIAFLPLACGTIIAQLPTPNPIPRVAPRAHWVATPGVTGLPVGRTSNPGAASATKMYVFGGRLGNNTSTILNDLHEFDGVAWTQRNADGDPAAPPRRGRACIAWNSATNRLVVFGGEGAGGALLTDVWEWDPVTNVWTETTPTTGPIPPARRWSAMAFDPATGGLLVFGGRDASGEIGDTWLFIGGVWVPITSAVSPPVRRQHSMMTRPDFGDVVMCGGQDTGTSPATRHFDVWRWDGAAWSPIVATTPAVPASGVANQAVYDVVRQRIVMQGGNGNSTFGGATAYGTAYGGTPTDWTSEFDCLTNEWKLYGAPSFSTNDPVIGRVSRYFAAFVPALGKVYKVGGQPTSRVATYEYQATPVASTAAVGNGCNGVTMIANSAPWTGRTFSFSVAGLAPTSLVVTFIGFSTNPSPIPITPVPFPGCATLLVPAVLTLPMTNTGGTATASFPLADDPTTTILTPFLQAVQVETAGPLISNMSSSNALALTPGAL